ncbi:MAG: AAA-like domain-containing protein, partial [Candidatus Magnetomorum sp.]|nr:AAA-like domain-containing protein [Candidatus Magnetomorum sp.]
MTFKPPKRIFEDTGYVDPEKAYHVHIENVVNRHNQDLKTMVDHGRYFSIFAPRQSGKTTFFRAFAKELESNTNYIFILMSFEYCKNNDTETFYTYIQKKIYTQLLNRLKSVNCQDLKIVQNFVKTHHLTNCADFYSLFEELNRIITRKKIVIFIDEFDGIPHEEIETFLSTLRTLYQDYKAQKEKALYSVGLIGIRNITQLVVGGVSPFNIADHVEIPLFT